MYVTVTELSFGLGARAWMNILFDQMYVLVYADNKCTPRNDRLKRITAAGKPAGILVVGDPDQAAMWLDEGFTFVAVDYDLSILAREADRIRALYKD